MGKDYLNKALAVSVVFLFISLGTYFIAGSFILVSNILMNPENNCYLNPEGIVTLFD